MELGLIVAVAENDVIGKDGKLPWNIPEDLQRFKKLTHGYPIIMGRKTYESIGRPLPERRNIILSRNRDYGYKGIEVVGSLEEAINLLEDEYDKAYVIGGSKVYEESLPLVDRLELTRVHRIVKGDTYFPKIDYENWRKVREFKMKDFSFLTYTKR